MAWKHLQRDVLEDLIEVQGLVGRADPSDSYRLYRIKKEATEEGGLEAMRRAWRERQANSGLCRSCRTVADPGSKYCAKHRAKNAERARAAIARKKAA
jgi:hypothetical protein